jgi:hypothetical protein
LRIDARNAITIADAEPVVGWKIWRVEHDEERTRLRSVLYGSLWPPGRPAVAECKKLLRHRHEPPDVLCECGIHAAKSLGAWRHYLTVGDDRVFGLALLWGPMLEGELGWRAVSAYPLELRVPAQLADAEAVAAGLAVYAVPVEVVGAPARQREVVAA